MLQQMIMPNERLPGGSLAGSLAFSLLVIMGLCLIWSGPYLPLVDFPQNAAQIASLRDVMQGEFRWYYLAEVNIFTPYLVGYVPAALLALVLPLKSALALYLSLAYLTYLLACYCLRRKFSGVAALDYTFTFCFFGFAWQWGLFTFLIALPIGVFALLKFIDYAEKPTLRRAVGVFCIGILLMFSHATVFIYMSLLGGWLLLLKYYHRLPQLVLYVIPYFLLMCTLIFHTLLFANPDKDPEALVAFDDPLRKYGVLLMTVTGDGLGFRPQEIIYFSILALLVFCFGFKNRIKRTEYFLLGGFFILWMAIPYMLLGMGLLYQRFSILFLPLLSLVLVDRDKKARPVLLPMLPLLSAAILAFHYNDVARFNVQLDDYQQATAVMEDGQRVLSLIFDRSDPTETFRNGYLHFPSWYQAEHKGWVDFNFADFHPVLIRYKPEERPHLPYSHEWFPEDFKWHDYKARNYRYIIMRLDSEHSDSYAVELLKNDECQMEMISSAGPWRVFERKNCRD